MAIFLGASPFKNIHNMKTIPTIFRIAVLCIIAGAGFFFLLGEEHHDSALVYVLHFLADKIIAAVLIILAAALYRRWSHTDPLLRRYHDCCMEDE